jgi:hypothetical protein
LFFRLNFELGPTSRYPSGFAPPEIACVFHAPEAIHVIKEITAKDKGTSQKAVVITVIPGDRCSHERSGLVLFAHAIGFKGEEPYGQDQPESCVAGRNRGRDRDLKEF